MNTKTEAMDLLLAPPPPYRETEEYAMAAHSTLEKELVRALNEARGLLVTTVEEAVVQQGGARPDANEIAAYIVLGRERLASQLGR